MGIEHHHTQTGADHEFAVGSDHRLALQRVQYPLRSTLCPLNPGLHQQHRKLIASVAPCNVGVSYRFANALAQYGNRPVTHQMARRVVDGFQPIHVNHDQGNGLVGTKGSPQLPHNGLFEKAPHIHARLNVDGRHLIQTRVLNSYRRLIGKHLQQLYVVPVQGRAVQVQHPHHDFPHIQGDDGAVVHNLDFVLVERGEHQIVFLRVQAIRHHCAPSETACAYADGQLRLFVHDGQKTSRCCACLAVSGVLRQRRLHHHGRHDRQKGMDRTQQTRDLQHDAVQEIVQRLNAVQLGCCSKDVTQPFAALVQHLHCMG